MSVELVLFHSQRDVFSHYILSHHLSRDYRLVGQDLLLYICFQSTLQQVQTNGESLSCCKYGKCALRLIIGTCYRALIQTKGILLVLAGLQLRNACHSQTLILRSPSADALHSHFSLNKPIHLPSSHLSEAILPPFNCLFSTRSSSGPRSLLSPSLSLHHPPPSLIPLSLFPQHQSSSPSPPLLPTDPLLNVHRNTALLLRNLAPRLVSLYQRRRISPISLRSAVEPFLRKRLVACGFSASGAFVSHCRKLIRIMIRVMRRGERGRGKKGTTGGVLFHMT